MNYLSYDDGVFIHFHRVEDEFSARMMLTKALTDQFEKYGTRYTLKNIFQNRKRWLGYDVDKDHIYLRGCYTKDGNTFNKIDNDVDNTFNIIGGCLNYMRKGSFLIVKADWNPFYDKKADLFDTNRNSQMSESEMSELLKCVKDPVYFVENYCKVKTDKGYAPINLDGENS